MEHFIELLIALTFKRVSQRKTIFLCGYKMAILALKAVFNSGKCAGCFFHNKLKFVWMHNVNTLGSINYRVSALLTNLNSI